MRRGSSRALADIAHPPGQGQAKARHDLDNEAEHEILARDVAERRAKSRRLSGTNRERENADDHDPAEDFVEFHGVGL